MQKCLRYKSCTTCNSCIQTLADEPYCIGCVTNKCELKHIKIPLNRCNNVLDCVKRDNKVMCIGHYKYLQKHCKVCGTPKLKYDTLSYDDWYYCKLHKPKTNEQTQIISRLFCDLLDDDSISYLCKFL